MQSPSHQLARQNGQFILAGMPREQGPGEADISSFGAPSLTGGHHSISISKSISVPPEAETAPLSQPSIVVTPCFALPANVVDSVYPIPGTSVENTTLPHIVFKDPHLPWSRTPSHTREGEDGDSSRSYSTWLALLVFSHDELHSTDGQIDNLLHKMPAEVKREQSETCTLRMLSRDTVNLGGIDDIVNATSFNAELDASEASDCTEIVLLPGELFTSLFVEPGGPKDSLNVAEYKHMAHVRKWVTNGHLAGGSDADESWRSVVVSRRTGPIEADTPNVMIAHLLSLIWEANMPFPKSQDRVAVTSLYSWTYTCLPSENVAGRSVRLTNLGQQLTVVRTDEVDAALISKEGTKNHDDRVEDLIAARQSDGYTIVRHRTVTGEVTASIVRGPLVPRQAKSPLSINIPIQCNNGQDLAIFDPRLGLLDVTYSSAWQLGKKLAMDDRDFCVALARLRRNMTQGPAFGDVHANPGQRPVRRMPGRPTAADMQSVLAGLNITGVHGQKGQEEQLIYNKDNIAASPDYATVYSWVLDKVHLSNVPANYLIPDPSFLPKETLRFFHLDTYWTDALIDGALSLSNHHASASEKDLARTTIKDVISKHLTASDANIEQKPRYGFLIRSDLFVQFPDMVIDVKFSDTNWTPHFDTGIPPANMPQQRVIAQKRIAPGTMCLLFSTVPTNLERIIFAIPPHKQHFRVGETLTAKFLEVIVEKLDTTAEGPSDVQPGGTIENVMFFPDGKPANFFDWKTRTLNPSIFAKYCIDEVGDRGTGYLTGEVPTSAVMALQLQEPVIQLDIGDICARTNRP